MAKEIMRVTLGAAQIMEACERFVQLESGYSTVPIPADRTYYAIDVPNDLSVTVVISPKRVRKAKQKT